jgi:hypothetical protein
MWQIFVVVDAGHPYNGGFRHLRLILSSNWESWPGIVAPYPEDTKFPWETIDHFRRVT